MILYLSSQTTKLKIMTKQITKQRVSKAILSVMSSPNKSIQRAALWMRLQNLRNKLDR